MTDNSEFITEFVEEAIAHIESVESALLDLEKGLVTDDLINRIFRAVHSIKGTAGFFGLVNIVKLSHAMENLFGDLRAGEIQYQADMTDVLLEAVDELRQMVTYIDSSNQRELEKLFLKLRLLNENIPLVLTQGSLPEDNSRVKVVSESGQCWEFAGPEKHIIREGLCHGHHLYCISLQMNRDMDQGSLNPMKFMRIITSIGSIVLSYVDTSAIYDLESALTEDIRFVFLFSTVLDKNLVAIALDIKENIITPVHVQEDYCPDKPDQLSESVDSSAPLSADRGDSPDHPDQAGQDVAADKTAGNVSSDSGRDTAAGGLHRSDSLPSMPAADFSGPAGGEDSVRVSVKVLNELLNLAGEMVLARNQLLRMMEAQRKRAGGVDRVLQNVDHLTTELQEKVMQTRMQPISNVFNKFPRLVRDLSGRMGKEVELTIEGSEVELDKSIIEALADPLTHILRNAVDHGIESPDLRAASGKPRAGRIYLAAYHEGGQVHVDIGDDGAGMDPERIKEAAISKSILQESEAVRLTESEVLALIFKPGFSTAEKLSDISGRGVGMDVVKTNIEKLGGSINIRTERGRGTNFGLTLPLTVAIISSLIVEVKGHKFALPQVNLQEMVRIKDNEQARRIELVNGVPVLRLRGALLPIVQLADVLDIEGSPSSSREGEKPSDEKEILRNIQGENGVIRILVLKAGGKRYGLGVDVIHGDEEILVKPLPHYLKNCSAYSGVTIMGDGRTAMILDPIGIADKAGLKFPDNKQIAREAVPGDVYDRYEVQNIMLFKCSGQETFGIDLSMVARVEEIKAEQIERLGQHEYIQYRGDALRIIRPEDFLQVGKCDQTAGRLYVIIPKLVEGRLGVLIERIYDTAETVVCFNESYTRSKGILGSAIIKGRITLMLNLFDLFEIANPRAVSAASGREAQGPEEGLEEARVLLLEDTPFFARVIKEYLESAGCAVLEASNGLEGLELLRNQSVDLIVSDINMPHMDGIQFIRTVRSKAEYAGIPALAISSLAGDKHIEAVMKAGFDEYESKLNKVCLLAKLNAILRRRGEAYAR